MHQNGDVVVKCLSQNHPEKNSMKIQHLDLEVHNGYSNLLKHLWGVKPWLMAFNKKFFMLYNDIGDETMDAQDQPVVEFRKWPDIAKMYQGYHVYGGGVRAKGKFGNLHVGPFNVMVQSLLHFFFLCNQTRNQHQDCSSGCYIYLKFIKNYNSSFFCC